jgi:EAL domain-containing protein (putative c-di-GMP-specific phosphodiesterase class I)
MATKAAPRAAVKRALDQKQLVVFYQPIHELKSRRVVAAEALLRARRRSGEIRNAARLTAAAEQGPDLYRLDSWMIRRAFGDAAAWQSDGAPKVRLHVNVSGREVVERGLSTRLRGLAKASGIDLADVNVEITETSFIAKLRPAAHALEQVKSTGAEIWLDDFGTVHSSLSHLLHFPVDGFKLPADFIKPLGADERARTLVRQLIELAHALGVRVIAEGVEHDDQLAVLREAECDYIQGFLYSKPMPVERFRALLTRPSR